MHNRITTSIIIFYIATLHAGNVPSMCCPETKSSTKKEIAQTKVIELMEIKPAATAPLPFKKPTTDGKETATATDEMEEITL